MTRKELNSLLKMWEQAYKNTEAVYTKLDELGGIAPESSLSKALWKNFDLYTITLSTLIKDDFNFLSWYVWDNHCGGYGMSAKASTWKKERKIKSIKDLADLIYDSMKK